MYSLAIFQKTMVFERQDAYDDYQEETTRLDVDFTINTAINVTKNYKLKTSNCVDEMVVSPTTDYQHVVVKPDDGTEGDPYTDGREYMFYDTLLIAPGLNESRCDPAKKPPQVPFVLGARGILFRRRSTPYFTTMSNPEGYIE